MIVADDVTADRVLAVVREAGAPLIADAGVFDVYRGEQVGEGRVSLALHLAFRAADRTLVRRGRRAAARADRARPGA